MKHFLLLTLVGLIALFAAGCQTVTGGNYVLHNGETISGDLNIYGGDSTLEPGSRVTGSIYVVGGNTQANAQIDGDVLVSGGQIDFGPSAVVRGVVQESGGSVHVAPGASIRPVEYGPAAGSRWLGNVLSAVFLIPLMFIVAVILLVTMGSARRVAPQSTAGQPGAEESPAPMAMSAATRGAGLGGSLVGGVILIALGILFFFQQFLNADVWHYIWPFLFLAPGLLCFGGMFLSGRNDGRLALPGSILTMLGLIFLYQNTFVQYQTWAYAWALIVASVGIGQFIQGLWTGRSDLRARGLIQTRNGLILFLIFAAFFELVLNLSGWFWGDLARFVFPVLLILVGMLLLFGRFFNRPVLSS